MEFTDLNFKLIYSQTNRYIMEYLDIIHGYQTTYQQVVDIYIGNLFLKFQNRTNKYVQSRYRILQNDMQT